VGEPVYRPNDVPARLAAIERELRDLNNRLDQWRGVDDERFAEISKTLAVLAESVTPKGEQGVGQ
jgi:hypothetical protein